MGEATLKIDYAMTGARWDDGAAVPLCFIFDMARLLWDEDFNLWCN